MDAEYDSRVRPRMKQPNPNHLSINAGRNNRRAGQFRLAASLAVTFAALYWLGSGCLDQIVADRAKKYVKEANKSVLQTEVMADDFKKLIALPSDRSQLKSLLARMEHSSRNAGEAINGLDPPKSLEEAHLMLKIAFDLRADALSRYGDVLSNALSDRDSEVAVLQMMSVWQELALADRAQDRWQHLADEALPRIRGSGGAEITKGARILDPSILDRTYALDYLERLRQQSALAVSHGIAIISLATTPPAKITNRESGLHTLTAASKFKVKTTLENQGNQVERDLVVRVLLKSEVNPVEQVEQRIIEKLIPGQRIEIVFDNLVAREEGLVYLLTAIVEPVPGEKIQENNRQELKFVAI